MDPKITTLIAMAVVAVVLVALALIFSRRRRREHLREKFGTEYERVVHQQGDPMRAESVLIAREKRVSALRLRTLPTAERERYVEQWTFVQKQFVDDPRGAVNEADRLVTDAMNARGYPMSDFVRRAEDLSVHYPDLVGNYRTAHEIALRDGRLQASTEDLRRAMVRFRELFEELLGTHTMTTMTTNSEIA